MPWTFAHAAAIVPFRRWCPGRLSFFALVIGSLTPDLGYYFGLSTIASFAHTVPGLLVCLPAGLLLAVATWYLRDLLVVLLPQPHRHALQAAYVAVSADFTRRRFIVLGVSILLGALTHIVWDSFTHASGPPVAHIGLLRYEAFQVGALRAPVYALLQHASTVFGIVVLARVYRSWLRGGRIATAAARDGSEAARWWILGAIAALGAAVLAAWVAAGIGRSMDVPGVVVRGVLFSTNVMVAAYLATALVFRWLASRGRNGGPS